MKFTLEPYQSTAVESVLTHLAKARAGYLDDGERTAVGLTAPTGAGKTVIATAVRRDLQGHAHADSEPGHDGPVDHR